MSDTIKQRSAIILVNLGTPDEPTAGAIARYLKQFLSDARVVNIPRWLWLPILNLIILKKRPAKLVEKYQLVWGRFDGPIRNITRALTQRLKQRFEATQADDVIAFAMTYGNPSINSVIDQLEKENVKRILFLPLFPQWAGATVGAVEDEVGRALIHRQHQYQFKVVNNYHTEPKYIQAVANSITRAKSYRDGKPLILFSFHGIPQAQVNQGDPYPQQCAETAQLIAAQLKLDAEQWMLTYQSRFGYAPWLEPYTDMTLQALPSQGITDVLVVCPGFAVDCLETIEEIKLLNKSKFLDAGGKKFSYVKALNASWEHIDVMEAVIQRHRAER